MMQKIGIVTVLYKSENVIEGFLNSLYNQKESCFFLYIVDNSVSEASTQQLNSLIEAYDFTNRCKHIKSVVNVGIAKGNNIGIEAALKDECEYILLANNDIEFYQEDILEQMLAKCVDSFICSPKIYYFDRKDIIWYAGGYISKVTGLAPHYGRNKKDAEVYSKQKYVKYGPTCFMLFKSEVFKDVGLMDVNYFVYFDDSDFLMRCNKKGYSILLIPSLYIYHKVANSSGGHRSPFYVELISRNRFYFLIKNFNGFSFISVFCFGIGITLFRLLTLPTLSQKLSLIKGTKSGIKLIKSSLFSKTDDNKNGEKEYQNKLR
jgi:GT2 family glycosyltransferase